MNSTDTYPSKQGDLALVLGATGFIGQYLIERLKQKGYGIRVYSRKTYAEACMQSVKESDWITGSLDDSEALHAAFSGVDCVFHLANVAHVNSPDQEEMRRINVQGTESVCSACLSAGVARLVYFSSCLAANPARSLYAETKRAAEEIVLAAGKAENSALHVSVLRPVNVYGVGMKGNIAGLIKRIVRGRMPPLPRLHNKLALISVSDLCQAALSAAEGSQTSGNIYTLTDQEAYTPNRIEVAVYAALGQKRPGWYAPRVIFYAAALTAQLLDRVGVWKNDVGLRTYHNLVSDQAVGGDNFANDLGYKPTQSLESELPQIIKSLD